MKVWIYRPDIAWFNRKYGCQNLYNAKGKNYYEAREEEHSERKEIKRLSDKIHEDVLNVKMEVPND